MISSHPVHRNCAATVSLALFSSTFCLRSRKRFFFNRTNSNRKQATVQICHLDYSQESWCKMPYQLARVIWRTGKIGWWLSIDTTWTSSIERCTDHNRCFDCKMFDSACSRLCPCWTLPIAEVLRVYWAMSIGVHNYAIHWTRLVNVFLKNKSAIVPTPDCDSIINGMWNEVADAILLTQKWNTSRYQFYSWMIDGSIGTIRHHVAHRQILPTVELRVVWHLDRRSMKIDCTFMAMVTMMTAVTAILSQRKGFALHHQFEVLETNVCNW